MKIKPHKTTRTFQIRGGRSFFGNEPGIHPGAGPADPLARGPGRPATRHTTVRLPRQRGRLLRQARGLHVRRLLRPHPGRLPPGHGRRRLRPIQVSVLIWGVHPIVCGFSASSRESSLCSRAKLAFLFSLCRIAARRDAQWVARVSARIVYSLGILSVATWLSFLF